VLAATTSTLQPRPYQLDGIEWLRSKRRAFLTDSFGLGKTLQAIWAAERPCLVTCPGHLLGLWEREILRAYPDALVRTASATSVEARKLQLNHGRGVFPGGGDVADFYIMNIEMLRTQPHIWLDVLRPAWRNRGIGIKTWIVDEAHRLRGRTSQQYAGAREVAARVPQVFLLTATPVYNQPNDLFAQLALLDPKRFSSYWTFIDTYMAVHQTPWGPRILGLKKGKKLLDVFREYAMGRSRQDVRAQLPELQETVVELEPPRDWYEAYEKAKREYRRQVREAGGLGRWTQVGKQGVLQHLRALTAKVKLQAVCELVLDSCAQDTLIFTYHRELAKDVAAAFKATAETGDLAPNLREQAIRGHDFAVATFSSIAEGVDASHMRNVILVEHDWQPGLIDQAMNRVHRPGNVHATTAVYHLMVKRTVDSALYNTYRRRGTTLDEVVGAVLQPASGFDDEEDDDA